MNLFSNKKIQELVRIFFYILIYCFILNILHISCPIKFITGVSCAGCGMTRAYQALLQGNIQAAYSYHPLFWTLPILALIYIFSDKIPKKAIKIIIAVTLIGYLTCYIIRMLNPNDLVVIFNPKESIFYKLITGGKINVLQ